MPRSNAQQKGHIPPRSQCPLILLAPQLPLSKTKTRGGASREHTLPRGLCRLGGTAGFPAQVDIGVFSGQGAIARPRLWLHLQVVVPRKRTQADRISHPLQDTGSLARPDRMQTKGEWKGGSCEDFWTWCDLQAWMGMMPTLPASKMQWFPACAASNVEI